ncbi:LacI family DNA-binding transcriptional regulator [Bifidobacterium saguinibicoloris]|uniref:LacI family DNA-binding transcriptional regulator n=1 Tax=Bifidobacterium saguinibicoloris TaxID=2834433 RepID=UPI001C5642B1|nr:LacI family DNA-binding transcriptional regulator [Bifidobacterium saguinibicoloris]MBW3080964.1 LacI family DNA-binding transcriptional regulator [Bifidobacterium saguinibicoloris]
MVGMRDVARKAGVSLSTVSLVVNGTGYVSDDMRAKVREAMRALDYIPNELARNLAHNRTNMIGVIVPTIRHPFFATLTAALQREFSARGLRTMLCSTADSDKGEADYVDMLQRHMMDGIVMAAHTAHPAGYWTGIGRPVVAFDRYLGPGIPAIGSDHEQGGRLVARALIESGARHVVMVGGPRSQFHDLDAEGAFDAGELAEAGVTTFPTVRYYLTLEHELAEAGVRYDYVEAGEVSDFTGYGAAMREVFDRYDDVDAVVSSDIGASLCVQEAVRRGVTIPRDLQVVAYDGTYLADIAGVRLTAVRQDVDALAAAVAARMTALIEGTNGRDGTRTRDAAASSAAASETMTDPTAEPAASSVSVGDGRLLGSVTELVPLTLRQGDSTR